MPTIEIARESIYQSFVTGWGSFTPSTLENEVFNPTTGVSYVRMVVRHDDRAQETLGAVGNRKFETDGRVVVQIFTPIDKGAGVADPIVEKVRSIFEGKTIDSIRYYIVNSRELNPDGKWNMVVAEVAFVYNETK